MKDTPLGMNRTGIDMSPVDAKQMTEGAEHATPSSAEGPDLMVSERATFTAQAEPIGSVPIPGTVRGAANTLLQKIKGENPEVLFDKIGERIAFERTGARLYELLIGKCQARAEEASGVSLDVLIRIHNEEVDHFEMLVEAMRSLGGDPTAQTPSADVSGVAASGLLQVLSDPRTTVNQCLQTILLAEHGDHEGWLSLIRLAESAGLDEIVSKFEAAYAEETRHVDDIRSFLTHVHVGDATRH